jgi:hypothetical protein
MTQNMGSAYGGAMQGWNQVGQLGVDKYKADVSAYSAKQQADATAAAGMGQAFGTVGAAYLKYGSDIRIKENIKRIGTLPSGLGIYEFEYKTEFKNKKHNGYGRYIGVMAQEVEQIFPEAVSTTEDGFKAVDYSKVQ